MATFIQDYWSSFREELIATSLVLIVAVGGSFFILNRLINSTNQSVLNDNLSQANGDNPATGEVLGQQSVTVPPPSPTTEPMPIPSPTPNQFAAQVYYGTGGLYDNTFYKLAINSPRLEFDAREPTTRKFVVDIVLTNKTAAGGLQNMLTGTIIKDGTVIVPIAAMSVSQAVVLMPGESASFSARLSLISGTDVSTISFKPPNNLPPTDHTLRP